MLHHDYVTSEIEMGSCAKQLCGFTAALFLQFPDTVYSFSAKSQGVQRWEVVPSFANKGDRRLCATCSVTWTNVRHKTSYKSLTLCWMIALWSTIPSIIKVSFSAFYFSSEPVPRFHAPIGKMVKGPRMLTAWCPDSTQHCRAACSHSAADRGVQMFLH